jgi:hypothetical protein
MGIPTAVRGLLATVAVALLVVLYLLHATVGWVALGAVAIAAVTRNRRAAAAKTMVPRGALM